MENRAKYAKKNDKGQSGEFDLSIGKIPPQALDLEEAILGAIMIERNAFLEVCSEITPETFYKESHGKIFKAFLELYSESQPIDMLTVRNKLIANGDFETCGGLIYLATLTRNINSSANIVFHATILKEYHAKRQFILMGSQLLQKGYEETTDIFDLTDFASNEFLKINDALISNSRTQKTVQQQFAKMFELMDLAESNDGLLGIPSKFVGYTRETGGYTRGSLTIIGARPAMGKSLHMVNEAVFQVQAGYHVAIFSMEMPAEQQLYRVTSNLTKIDSKLIKRKELTVEHHKEIAVALSRFPMNNLTIFDQASQSLNYIKSCCQKRKMSGKLDVIFIDYLQLIEKFSGPGSNEVTELGKISRGLKVMANELDIAIIAYSQLNRAVESRAGDKKPQLSDLRQSGSIEQDADVVVFLHRESYYNPLPENKDKGEILIRKNREGDLSDVVYNWMPHKGTMQDFEIEYQKFEVVKPGEISGFTQIQQNHDFNNNSVLNQVEVNF